MQAAGFTAAAVTLAAGSGRPMVPAPITVLRNRTAIIRTSTITTDIRTRLTFTRTARGSVITPAISTATITSIIRTRTADSTAGSGRAISFDLAAAVRDVS